MQKGLKRLLIIYITVFLSISGITPAYAELSIEETRKLLQQSLTVVQIDQEISRITQEETTITIEIIKSEVEMTLQEKKTAKTRERLGKVLRSYYKGERESLWLLIFNAKSFGQLLRMYNYLSYLYKSDEIAFQAYKAEYRTLKNLRQKLEITKTGLANLKQEFIKQRERVVSLQQEIDQTLDAHPDAAAAIAIQLEQVKSDW
ncbi:MAG: hypothetical protein H7X86_12490, partial [Gorillibacterium sp.]|nr:hypothetical protein [Gorillibacterium sp.]